MKAKRIVFVNGRYDAKRSQLPQGTVVTPMALADDTIVAIGAKLAAEGANLVLEGNMDLPVEIIHVATAGPQRAMAHRHTVTVAAGGSASLIETFVGEGDYLSNAVVEINVGEGARLDRVKIEREFTNATHLGHAIVNLARTRSCATSRCPLARP